VEDELMNFSLPDEAFEDFSSLQKISEQQLRDFLRSLREIKKTILSTSELQSVARKAMGQQVPVGALTRFLFFVVQLSRTSKEAPSKIVKQVSDGYFVWSKAETAEDRPELLKVIADLSESQHVLACSKAITLSYASDHIYQGASIICDIRPVYNDDGEGVLGFISIQDLHVDFYRSGRRHHLVLAMDRNDVTALKETCERALKKIDTSLSMVRDKFGVEAVVAGEDGFGFED
jgi:hypothetical protein|tara:strand:+ start:220 stop:918 length:699 start_codon:yes stop_codon:yes gene_type:complete